MLYACSADCKTAEQQEDYGKFSNFLKISCKSFIRFVIVKMFILWKDAIMQRCIAVKERIVGILHSVHSFIYSVISNA